MPTGLNGADMMASCTVVAGSGTCSTLAVEVPELLRYAVDCWLGRMADWSFSAYVLGFGGLHQPLQAWVARASAQLASWLL